MLHRLDAMNQRSDKVRRVVLARDKKQCQKCESLYNPQVHHIVAVADGGTDDLANLVTLCRRCHKEWHEYAEAVIDFQTWIKFPPMRAVAAVMWKGGMIDDDTIENIRIGWAAFMILHNCEYLNSRLPEGGTKEPEPPRVDRITIPEWAGAKTN